MTNEHIQTRWHALLFGVRRSIRYHNHRRKVFDALGVWTDFLTIISGGAVVFFAMTDQVTSSAVFGAAAGILAALDLVIGFSIKARHHVDLARQFSKLEQEITLIGDAPTQDELKRKINVRLEIESAEPPTKRTLDAWCHNELLCAMGYAEAEKVELTFLQVALKQFVSVGEYRQKTRN